MINGKKAGFILRSPDSGINPYLAFTMIIRAGLAGIKNNEKLPAPVDKSWRHLTEDEKAAYQKLPMSLEEAIDCAKNSDFLNEDESLHAIVERFLSVLSM